MYAKDIMTVSGVMNLRSAIENEDRAREEWLPKYGWITEEYRELEKKLKELKSKRLYGPKAEEPPELIDPGYYPQTTNGEYGWLCYNPEFQLEDVGAYPNTRQYFRQLFGDSEN